MKADEWAKIAQRSALAHRRWSKALGNRDDLRSHFAGNAQAPTQDFHNGYDMVDRAHRGWGWDLERGEHGGGGAGGSNAHSRHAN